MPHVTPPPRPSMPVIDTSAIDVPRVKPPRRPDVPRPEARAVVIRPAESLKFGFFAGLGFVACCLFLWLVIFVVGLLGGLAFLSLGTGVKDAPRVEAEL